MRAVSLLLITCALGCADDKIHHLPDGCTGGDFMMTIGGPTTYACHDHFTPTITITNDSCDTITIASIAISAVVTTGNCVPPGNSSGPPMVANVDPLQTTEVLDFAGGQFCCFQMACPASFQCDETYTYVATTTTGATITGTAVNHLSLDNCDVICP